MANGYSDSDPDGIHFNPQFYPNLRGGGYRVRRDWNGAKWPRSSETHVTAYREDYHHSTQHNSISRSYGGQQTHTARSKSRFNSLNRSENSRSRSAQAAATQIYPRITETARVDLTRDSNRKAPPPDQRATREESFHQFTSKSNHDQTSLHHSGQRFNHISSFDHNDSRITSQHFYRGRGGRAYRGKARGGRMAASSFNAREDRKGRDVSHERMYSPGLTGQRNELIDSTIVNDQLQVSVDDNILSHRSSNKVSYGRKNASGALSRATGFKYTTIPQFLQLCNSLPETIAIELLHDLKSFQKVILNSKKVGDRRDDMFKILSILLKLTEVSGPEQDSANCVLAETFNSRSSQFCFKLQQFVQSVSSEDEFLLLVNLFDAVLKLLPSSWDVLPVEDLKEGMSSHAPSLTDNSVYLSMVALYQEAQQCVFIENVVVNEDYSEYRNISVLPTTAEVNEFLPPKLHPNIVEGSYKSWEHYYDIQFKLLREDFIAPLRRGICGYREGLRGRDISDVRVYYNVTFTGLQFNAGGIIVSVQCDGAKFRKVNWKHSKRLIFGSLLCFSYNNFETVIFASIVGRDLDELNEGRFTVKIESGMDVLNLMSNTNDCYTMIESQAHYETYYHILCSLQKAEVETMPFTDILIESKCSKVSPPIYMCLSDDSDNTIDHPQLVFNMKNALGMSSRHIKAHSFDVSKPECWPSVELTRLDQSQLDAMKMALSQKVSVIQGPPGTGKTYIGIKIVQALLTNRHIWDSARNSPLLVVCYTNHALDQFLQQIIELHSKDCQYSLVRVGGRCQNEMVANFGIKNLEMRHAKVPRIVYEETREIRRELKWKGSDLDYQFQVIQGNSEPYLKDLIQFIAPIHRAQLTAIHRAQLTAIHRAQLNYAAKFRRWGNALYDSDSDDDDDDGCYKIDELVQEILSWIEGCSDEPQVEDLFGENITYNAFEPGTVRYDESDDGSDSTSGSGDVSDKDINDVTVNVVGEAELAAGERMVDEPAVLYRHETVGIGKINLNPEISIKGAKGFTHSTVSRIHDIFKLSNINRQRLYNYWKEQYVTHLYNKLHADFQEYTSLCKQYREATQQEDLYIFEKVDLVGMTTTGAAKYQHIIQKLKPKIIIAEEAAEVLESHIVSCLTAATQQLILIGDHKQLQPKPNEYHLARDYNLDISLFERLIRAGIPHATLEIQHRMRPEIAGLVCPHIYSHLLNHESVLQYNNVQGVATNMYFFHHEYPEVENDELRSHSNEEEAKLVVGLCDYLLKQGYLPEQITVLTTYTSQLLKLKNLMPKSTFEGVRITAVDNFQGEENDIILLSLVRSNTIGKVGFLKIDNRVCVALSRAKKGFFCFGNFKLLRESSNTWKNILSYLEQQNKLGSCLPLCCFNHGDVNTEIGVVEDFGKVPQGGCDKPCDTRLECGHVCKLFCHPKDPDHEDYTCNQPCTETCENGHPCVNLCYQTCPRLCEVIVEKTIPGCGHIQNVPCHLNPARFSCQAPCTKRCVQGHLCNKLCSQPCGDCESIVQKAHPKCGRIQDMYCYQNPSSSFVCQYPCNNKCTTNPSNPHPCEKLCYLPCGNCEVPVLKTLPQCGHEQLVECYHNPLYYLCQEACERKLQCGHPCTSRCGLPCTEKCKEEVEKILPCGHPVVLQCSEPTEGVICQVEVEKAFPVCGHSVSLPCSKPISDVYCQEMVHRRLPCQHETFMKCSKKVEDFKCKTNIKISLTCGHVFEGICSKKDDECTILTTKQFVGCKHKMKLPCCEDLPVKCQEKCTAKLLCGHQCSGTCSECYQGRMHKPCHFQMFALACGHYTQAACTSLFSLCQGKCEYACVHRKVCTHNCSQPCNSCKQRCSWRCPHYTCPKLCYEICDRPRCDHPCRYTLQCKHPCIGVCGEPCPRVCRICKRQKDLFRSWCVGTASTKKEVRYIQLNCNHLFEVKELDQLLDKQFGSGVIVQPLVCPACDKQIHSSYRYGNLIKKKREMIERVRTIMTQPASKEQQEAVIKKVISQFIPSFTGYDDYKELGYSLKHRSVARCMPLVFRKPQKLLLASSISSVQVDVLDNEIDQYVLLKEYEHVYEQFPDLSTSLQELITFFINSPPSLQKYRDVSCEKQRIFLLWMITSLTNTTLQSEDCNFIKQLEEKLISNNPKPTLTSLAAHYDALQGIAKKVRKRFDVDSRHMQPNKVVSVGGIWMICENNHAYCKPRGWNSSSDGDEWQCPNCPQ